MSDENNSGCELMNECDFYKTVLILKNRGEFNEEIENYDIEFCAVGGECEPKLSLLIKEVETGVLA